MANMLWTAHIWHQTLAKCIYHKMNAIREELVDAKGVYKNGCRTQVEGVGLLVNDSLDNHGTTIQL